MLHHIKKLHTHPEHVREKVAIGGALLVTAVIFAAWVMTLDARLALSDDWDAAGDQTASAANAGGLTVVNERKTEPRSPGGILKEKVGETYREFREAMGY